MSKTGIRVETRCPPGIIKTPICIHPKRIRQLAALHTDGADGRYIRTSSTPCLYLDGAGFVTGEVLHVRWEDRPPAHQWRWDEATMLRPPSGRCAFAAPARRPFSDARPDFADRSSRAGALRPSRGFFDEASAIIPVVAPGLGLRPAFQGASRSGIEWIVLGLGRELFRPALLQRVEDGAGVHPRGAGSMCFSSNRRGPKHRGAADQFRARSR